MLQFFLCMENMYIVLCVCIHAYICMHAHTHTTHTQNYTSSYILLKVEENKSAIVLYIKQIIFENLFLYNCVFKTIKCFAAAGVQFFAKINLYQLCT